MISGIDSFRNESRMLGGLIAIFRREPRRLITQQDDDLALYIYPRVIVVIVFVGRSPITRKNYRPCSLARCREAERNKIVVEQQILVDLGHLLVHEIDARELGARNYAERLQKALRTGGLK